MKTKLLFLTLVLISITININAQTLKVYNNSNLKPIENVLIVNNNQTNSVLTNYKGEADISSFAKTDDLLFQHPAYQRLMINHKEIESLNFVVKLNESHIKIDEVLISANKWEQQGNEIPNKIVAIRSENVELMNPQTSADLLKTTNEVFVQKSQLGGGSPMIRGFSANSVLLVYDGVRMNNAIYRSGNLQNVISIDPNIIESAEVIFGPGSVIYGSDALGGVMDFHTIQPRLTSNHKPFIKSNALVRWSSANNENTAHFDINLGYQKLGFFTSVSYSDFDNLRMGNNGNKEYVRSEYVETINNVDTIMPNLEGNIQKPTAYSQLNITQKIRFKPSKNLDFNYGFHYSKTSNIPRYDRLIQYSGDNLKYAKWEYGPMYWMLNTLNATYKKSNQLFDQASFNLAYQDYEESRIDRKFQNIDERNRTENVDVISLNLDFNKTISENTEIFYGAEGIYNYVKSEGFTKNITNDSTQLTSSRYPDGGTDYYSISAYVSAKHNLTEQLTLNGGIRYSYHHMKSVLNDTTIFQFPYNAIKLSPSALNGSLGAVYHPFEKSFFNLNLSSGFRAPNLDDVAKIFDSEPGKVIVPNKDLKPEYAYNVDIGYEQHINDIIKFEITLFYTWLKDAMVRRDYTFNGQDSIFYDGELSQVQAIVNANSANMYGFNAGLYAKINESITFTTHLTLMDGEDSDGFAIRHVPPTFHISHLIFTRENFKADFYIEYNGEISAENLAPSEQDKEYMYKIDANGDAYSPSWYTINFKVAYQLNEHVQMNVGLENIMDIRYRPYSSGLVAPGRNLIFSLRANI
jgi:outer membrane receptor protein involved in Fe transport